MMKRHDTLKPLGNCSVIVVIWGWVIYNVHKAADDNVVTYDSALHHVNRGQEQKTPASDFLQTTARGFSFARWGPRTFKVKREYTTNAINSTL